MAGRFRAWLCGLLHSREVEQLRDTVRELQQEKLLLQARLDVVLADRARMWDLMTRSIDEMKISYQSHINVQWQGRSGTVPYPEAPHLPPHAVPKVQGGEPVGRRGRMLPSEMVAQKTREFVAEQLAGRDQ